MVLRLFRAIGLLTTLTSVLFLASCTSGGSPIGQSNQLVVQASMKQLGLGNSVSSVRLTITGDAIDEIVLEDNFVGGVVTFEFELPAGQGTQELTFVMSALDAEGTVLYEGTDVAEITPGAVTNVEIVMQPQAPMIRVTPRYLQLASGSETGQISVEIHNVDDLFGVSFRIEFDSTAIRVDNVTEGPIFDPNETIYLARIEADYVAVALTMLGSQSQQGVDGGGLVATFDLQPGLTSGTTEIVINPETVRLIDWEGNSLPAIGRLYIEDGEVEIIEQ